MDWASRTTRPTTVTPAWTKPGYDGRTVTSSLSGDGTEEEKTFQNNNSNKIEEQGEWTVILLYN